VESVCYRLLNEPATAQVPVVLVAGNGTAERIEGKYNNVVRVLPKPMTQDSLQEVLEATLPRPQCAGKSRAVTSFL
jgi:CheY-like chemotaxis protein